MITIKFLKLNYLAAVVSIPCTQCGPISLTWYCNKLVLTNMACVHWLSYITKHNSCNLFILQIVSSHIERILWATFAWVSCYVLFWHALHQYNCRLAMLKLSFDFGFTKICSRTQTEICIDLQNLILQVVYLQMYLLDCVPGSVWAILERFY